MRYLILILFIGASCQSRNSDKEKLEVINTDKAFSQMSEEKGMKDAFIFYAAEDVIKPQEGSQPVVSREALIKSFEGFQRRATLTWYPVKADVSGDLGYTFGNWKRVSATDTLYGNYVSIWRRQPNGEWRFVLDTGNSTDGPTAMPGL